MKKEKKKNLTQRELAEKLDVTDKTVSRWENGHYLPDVSLFNEVCEILDIEVAELLKGEEINKIEKKDVDNTITKIVDISKKEIKQKNRLVVVSCCLFLLFIIILSFFVSQINSDRQEIKLNNIWLFYDKDISKIKENMDEISFDSDSFYWWGLKDFDIEDDEYENHLNGLVADIRICYMEFIRDGENHEASNPILDYRGREFITRKEVEVLESKMDENSVCLTRFYRYKSLLISYDEEVRNNFLEQIDDIIWVRESDLFVNDNPTFDELLSRKYLEVSMISRLSDWLVAEYYRLK